MNDIDHTIGNFREAMFALSKFLERAGIGFKDEEQDEAFDELQTFYSTRWY
jgi:prophage maintenance system killer protein